MNYPKNPGKAAHVIITGNEKGGSGKSTTAMHLIIGFLQRGYSVTSIDIDYRQGTLSRYIANRKNFIKAAHSVLNSTGSLLLVSNIQLPYENLINALFKNFKKGW